MDVLLYSYRHLFIKIIHSRDDDDDNYAFTEVSIPNHTSGLIETKPKHYKYELLITK